MWYMEWWIKLVHTPIVVNWTCLVYYLESTKKYYWYGMPNVWVGFAYWVVGMTSEISLAFGLSFTCSDRFLPWWSLFFYFSLALFPWITHLGVAPEFCEYYSVRMPMRWVIAKTKKSMGHNLYLETWPKRHYRLACCLRSCSVILHGRG